MPTDPVTTAEDAIHAWVVAGSGLDANHVIWTGDGPSGPMPEGTFISMRIVVDDSKGDDWMIPRRNQDNSITYAARSHHKATIELSCNAGAPYGSQRAAMILRRVLTAIELPSVIEAMSAADIGIGTFGKIRLVPGVRSGLLDPRAMVEVGVHMVTEATEAGSAIETVQVQTQTDAGIRTGTVTKP